MLRFAFIDIYKNTNNSYKKYKENLYFQKYFFDNKKANCLTIDNKSLIEKKQNIPPLYFNDEKYKWNRDYSKFTYIENENEKIGEKTSEKIGEKTSEKTGEKTTEDSNESVPVMTLTITAFMVGLGVCVYVFRRSFYLK
jgi:hypothetical protein